jgi:aflatoxin B1 aldehyde reductase
MSPTIIFGAASIGCKFSDLSSVSSLLTTLTAQGITQIDTAARYGANYGSGSAIGKFGDSEILLGKASAAERGFTIDSKVLFLANGEKELSSEKVEESTLRSLERLKVQRVRTLYTHAPDGLTPIAEQAAAMDAQVQAGRCDAVGLSNYSASMVAEFVAACDDNGYVRPTVYQGLYNLLRREPEESLLPLLRAEGFRFVAYSPLASGLLTVGDRKEGNALLDRLYGNEKIRRAVDQFKKRLEGSGVEATEAALRWVVFHSALRDGDAVIIGASRKEQVVSSMEIIRRGPLDNEVVEAVEQVWEDVRKLSKTL